MDTDDLLSKDIERSMRGMESQNSLLTKLLAEQRETNRLLRNLTEDLQPVVRRYCR